MTEKGFRDEIAENTLLSDEEEDEQLHDWGDWTGGDGEDWENPELEITCLFCDMKFPSSTPLFHHCSSLHYFHFNEIRKAFSLDIYCSFKLINYIRSQVYLNKCWCCVSCFSSKQDMQNHLHGITNYEKCTTPWEDDKYLTPFIRDDPLLYMFSEEDEEIEDGDFTALNKNELINNLKIFDESLHENNSEKLAVNDSSNNDRDHVSLSNGCSIDSNYTKSTEIGNIYQKECFNLNDINKNHAALSPSDAAVKQINHTNKSYFGSYSSFGIHREMIEDEVRMGAYRHALLDNPSLMKGAVVMDVGCGTGILSLFAAQAGASRVFAIEASAKMAAVANQIAVDNDVAWDGVTKKGVIQVIEGMVEELVGEGGLGEPQSVDVIVSEWMGYCLMCETMLSSVLFARDRWLKPGGAILPDTATMFVAGFGRGGTSTPFWEDVFGFNMSCIGKEEARSSARIPIVDFVHPSNILTHAALVQCFDLVEMKTEDMDFTEDVELEPTCGNLLGWTCYGVVLWFETKFTHRFCKEKEVILSTSPHRQKTHWAQTLLTLAEPISIGTGEYLHLRISMARDTTQHRSIDISLETAIIHDSYKRTCCPPQIFNLF